ncbi:glycoside hydrolase family 25 [Cellulomonas chitinilytica]|uniref:Lysozyme n=1 Tax=Cellulomonas chitinilytica TaxID=398759 RepID=A0A919P3R1_9CELL|nr:glycoside hydrolase family 25 [Cellulomonas chitinilytica]
MIAAATVLVLLGAAVALASRGVLWPNRAFAARYEVRGIDVSAHQGEVDWPTVARQGVDFAYVKATEGSSFVDARFEDNVREARAAGLLVGAYHFFSFESSGEAQAEHVLETVPDEEGLLPVAVDVEHYGAFQAHPPDVATVRAELTALLETLRAHGEEPVVYATQAAYERYVAGAFPGTPIWIRSVYVPPSMSDARAWTFWQYSAKERLDGFDGDEPFVDMNVFRGDADELRALASQP